MWAGTRASIEKYSVGERVGFSVPPEDRDGRNSPWYGVSSIEGIITTRSTGTFYRIGPPMIQPLVPPHIMPSGVTVHESWIVHYPQEHTCLDCKYEVKESGICALSTPRNPVHCGVGRCCLWKEKEETCLRTR